MRTLVLVMMVLTLAAYVWAFRAPEFGGIGIRNSATLEIMSDGPDLFVDLDVPATQLLGFDHAPTNSGEHEALLNAHRLLDSGRMIEPAPGAQCTLSESYATVGHGYDDLCSAGSTLLDTGEPGQTGLQNNSARWFADQTPEPGAPAVIAARWSWVCKRPLQLDRLNVRLFSEFERLNQLSVSVDGPKGQQYFTLDPDNAHVDLQDSELHTSSL